MQDMILLGFLLQGSKTGYQIKKMMETSTDFFFSTSFGSIYPAFKKLVKLGLATVEIEVDGGKQKKIYTITDSGREHFNSWLKQRPQISRIRDETALKVFFFANLQGDERILQITEYREELVQQIKELEGLKEFLTPKKLDFFQMYSLKIGIDYYNFIHDRMGELLSELEQW